MSGSLFPTRFLVKRTNGFGETQGAKSISKGVLSDLCAHVLSAFEFYGAFGRPKKFKHGEDRAQVDVLVGRPVALNVVKERRPVERQAVLLEILQRK